MGYTVSFDDEDELDKLFEFGTDEMPLSDLVNLDSLSDEQKQMLLMGKTPESEFDKEFYALFRHRESLMQQVFEMEKDEEDFDE